MPNPVPSSMYPSMPNPVPSSMHPSMPNPVPSSMHPSMPNPVPSSMHPSVPNPFVSNFPQSTLAQAWGVSPARLPSHDQRAFAKCHAMPSYHGRGAGAGAGAGSCPVNWVNRLAVARRVVVTPPSPFAMRARAPCTILSMFRRPSPGVVMQHGDMGTNEPQYYTHPSHVAHAVFTCTCDVSRIPSAWTLTTFKYDLSGSNMASRAPSRPATLFELAVWMGNHEVVRFCKSRGFEWSSICPSVAARAAHGWIVQEWITARGSRFGDMIALLNQCRRMKPVAKNQLVDQIFTLHHSVLMDTLARADIVCRLLIDLDCADVLKKAMDVMKNLPNADMGVIQNKYEEQCTKKQRTACLQVVKCNPLSST